MAGSKQDRRTKIKFKLRKSINGTSQSPRLSVYRSNAEIYAQLIDDKGGKTLLAVGSVDKSKDFISNCNLINNSRMS